MNYPPRVLAGVAVAAALSMWGAVEYFGFETACQAQSRDPYHVAAQAERLAGIPALAPDDAILGYMTDLELGTPAAWAMFNAAQYALAPRILRQDTAPNRVLGNFAHPADFGALGRQHSLSIERDFGNGIVLFRRDSAK